MRKIFLSLLALSIMASTGFAQDEVGHLRVMHLSSDVGEVDIYLIDSEDSLIFQQTFEFADASRWIEIDPGEYSVSVVLAEGEIEDAVLDMTLDVESGDWFTVAAIGDVGRENLSLQGLIEYYEPLDSFQARLSVFHAVPNYGPVNVFVNDVELIRYLGYPGFWGPDSDGFISFDLLAQTSDIRLEQEDGTVAVELEDVALGGNRHYFLAIAGVAGNPQFVFVPADLVDLDEDDNDVDEDE